MKYNNTFKTLTILLLIFIISAYQVKSQKWLWSQQFDSPKATEIRSLTLDQNNNLYITGRFNDSMDIGAPQKIYPLIGAIDIFYVKYDNNNNYLWHKVFGSDDRDWPKNAIADNSGNSYFSGIYRSNITIGPTVLPVYSPGFYDVFLVKFQPGGNQIFAKRVAWGPSNVRSEHMTIDDSQNLYIVGNFTDTAYFETDTLIGGSTQNHFIAKFDNNGNPIWIKHIIGTSENTSTSKLLELNTTSFDEIYVSGFFVDTLKIEGLNLNSQGSSEDIVLIKLNSSGDLQWARQAGSVNHPDRSNGVRSDIHGNVYIVGYISGEAYFDSTDVSTFNSTPINTVGNDDMFIAKYNKNGTLQWKRSNGDVGPDRAYGVYIHENILQYSGYFSGELVFNVDTIRSSGTTDNNTGFFVYDVDGNPITAHSISGKDEDRGELITYNASGDTYIGGYTLSDTLDFGSFYFVNEAAPKQNAFAASYQNPFSAAFSSIKNISCYGYNDGELIVTPYFGVGPYDYSWSPDVSDDSIASNLNAGYYYVTITDTRDSTATTYINLPQPLPISIMLDSTNLSCYESGDGAIDIEVTGGTVAGDYKYNWTGGTGLNPSGSDQSNLFAGIYNVTVTDDNNCTENASTTITQPDPITFAGSMVSPSIPSGSCSGSIDVEVQGGTPGYSFEWAKGGVPMPGRTSDTLNNLCGDTYVVTLTDDNLCVADTSFIVGDEDQLIVFIDSLAHITCNGYSNGYARVGISGDKGIDLSYTWEDSGGSPAGADTNYIANKSGGTYYLTVTENGGDNRKDSLSVTIQEPLLLTTSLVSTDPLCHGDVNGVINLSVSGGKPAYTYNWSTGQTTEDLLNVQGSTEYYKVTVTDKNGCQVLDSALLADPEEIVVNISVIQGLQCHGYFNAILRADVSGGIEPWDYLWNDPGHQTSQFATGLDAGNYEVTVTDDNGCQNTDSYELIEPEPVTIASVDSVHVSCKGSSDGSILITPAGGTAPYTFTWDRIPVDTNYVTGLSAAFGGEYSVIVSDINECPPASFSMQIKEPDIELNITENTGAHVDNECYGGNNGELAVSADGGWENYEFSLAGADWGTTTNYNGLASGNYYIRVRDSGECYDSVMVTISQPSEINIIEVAASHMNAECYGDNTGQLEVQASGGTPGYEYSIDNSNWNTNPLFENLYADSHIIWVRDANACIDSATFPVTEPEQLVLEATVSGDTINAAASGGSAPLFYSLNSGSLQVSGLFTGLSDGDYLVMVIDGHNCSTDTTVTVGEVEPPPPPPDSLITVYDAFSPNADGKNDVWNIGNIEEYPDCVVKIFNTWGTAVFISDGYEEPWDGTHNGKELPSGTYYYYIDLGDDNGIYTGTVNIVK